MLRWGAVTDGLAAFGSGFEAADLLDTALNSTLLYSTLPATTNEDSFSHAPASSGSLKTSPDSNLGGSGVFGEPRRSHIHGDHTLTHLLPHGFKLIILLKQLKVHMGDIILQFRNLVLP